MTLNEHVEKSILLAELGISKLNTDIYYLEGMSSPKGRRLLNLLCERPGTVYLEIGMWRGSSLISALYNNEKTVTKAIAIDNFSEFEKPLFVNSINFEDSITHNPKIPLSLLPVKEHLLSHIGTYLSSVWEIDRKLDIIDANCFDYRLNELKTEHAGQVNLYFYDGGHEEEDQYKAFTEYDKIFANQFIAIVDDYVINKNAEVGTKRAIKDLGYKILYEKVLPARYNGDVFQYWAGAGVFVFEKN